MRSRFRGTEFSEFDALFSIGEHFKCFPLFDNEKKENALERVPRGFSGVLRSRALRNNSRQVKRNAKIIPEKKEKEHDITRVYYIFISKYANEFLIKTGTDFLTTQLLEIPMGEWECQRDGGRGSIVRVPEISCIEDFDSRSFMIERADFRLLLKGARRWKTGAVFDWAPGRAHATARSPRPAGEEPERLNYNRSAGIRLRH